MVFLNNQVAKLRKKIFGFGEFNRVGR